MAALEAGFWHEAHASLTILRSVPHCESCTLGPGPHALSVNTATPRLPQHCWGTVCPHPHRDESREAAQAGPGCGLRAVWTGGMAQDRGSGLQAAHSLPCDREVTRGGPSGAQGRVSLGLSVRAAPGPSAVCRGVL